MLLVEAETLDDVFNNHLIKSKNKFISEDVNVMIESLRRDVKSFLKKEVKNEWKMAYEKR